MATSLSSQLKRLEAPQTSAFNSRKGRYSFLYSRNEAAGIDCATHYSIALEGLEELIQLDPGLEKYRNSLLSESSKSFERSVRSQEENEQLDQEIESFLLQLVTPFLIRVDCHKVLEYLIFKYRVNEFNTDALIMSALPYHGTSLFPKVLQSIPSFQKYAKKWSFMHCLQQQGSPINRNVLVNQCISQQWLLQLVVDTTQKEVSVSDGKSGKFATFATSIFLGCLISAGSEGENVMTVVQSFIDSGLSSGNRYFVLAAYTVASFACSKVQFVETFIQKLLSRACRKFCKYSFRDEIVEEFVLFVAVILEAQKLDASTLLPDALPSILVENMDLISHHPRVVNTVVRKLASSLTEDNLPVILKLTQSLSSTSSLTNDTVTVTEKFLRRVVKKKDLTPTARIQALQVTICLMRSGHCGVKKLKTLVSHGETVALLIDQLTLVGGAPDEEGYHRMPLSLKRQEWMDVTVLLELVSARKVQESGPLLEQCQMLLRESLAYEESSDMIYYQRLLLRVIHHIISADDFDWTGDKSPIPDASCIIEMMKAFRNREGVKSCISILKIMAKYRKAEILENYMRVFSFVGCKYGNCDDRVSMSLMDMILYDLVPSLTAGDATLVREVIDSLINCIISVAVHRRLVILNRFLHVTDFGDKGYDYVVYSLIQRSLRQQSEKMQDFYCSFCAQLLSSLKLSDSRRYLEPLFTLLLQSLSHSSPKVGGEGGNLDEKENSFLSLILSLPASDSSHRQSLSDSITKILIKTLASQEFIAKVLKRHHSPENSQETDNDRPEAGDVSDNSRLMPVIIIGSKLVDHVVACSSKGKETSTRSFHELIQNATLSSPVTSLVELASRLLRESCNASSHDSASDSHSELIKLAISIIWMNRERISEWKERDDHLLFQCVNSLALFSIASLQSLSLTVTVPAAVATNPVAGTASSPKAKRSRNGSRHKTQCLQLIQSALSMTKILLRAIGEVRDVDQRQFVHDNFSQFTDWVNEIVSKKSVEPKQSPFVLIPWVILTATQMLKSLGSDGQNHLSQMMSTLFKTLQSGNSLVVASAMSSLAVIVQLFPESINSYKKEILKYMPSKDSDSVTDASRDEARKITDARIAILSALGDR